MAGRLCSGKGGQIIHPVVGVQGGQGILLGITRRRGGCWPRRVTLSPLFNYNQVKEEVEEDAQLHGHGQN